MIKPGPDDKVYPVIKLATVVEALAAEEIPAQDALAGVRLSKEAISSPVTRISLNQVIECYSNAANLSRDPYFAYHTGQRFHLSAYGMYGFAILSSTDYRQTMQFAEKYHQLATPLTELRFKEQSGCGVWTITPMPHSRIDDSLYKFLIEMQFGICVSLHRDVMGPLFAAREFHVTYGAPDDAAKYQATFGCPVLFGDWMRGALNGKVGAAFSSSGTQHGGQEATLFSIIANLLHFGMIVVGLPYSHQGQMSVDEIVGGAPYGATTVAGPDGSRKPTSITSPCSPPRGACS